MEKNDYSVANVLKTCINSRITGIHEEDHEVLLYLNDGQRIKITALPEGGFTVDIQPGFFH